jgi:hypothetical protein
VSDQELASRIGSVCVSGEVLTGEALLKYLNLMPPKDKESMLDDLALLQSWAMLERGSVNCRTSGGMMPPGEAAAHVGTEGRETSPEMDAVPMSREARSDSSPNGEVSHSRAKNQKP